MARQLTSTILRDLARHSSVITTKINKTAFVPLRSIHLAMDMGGQRNSGEKDGSTAHPFDPDLQCTAQLSNICLTADQGMLLEKPRQCDQKAVRL